MNRSSTILTFCRTNHCSEFDACLLGVLQPIPPIHGSKGRAAIKDSFPTICGNVSTITSLGTVPSIWCALMNFKTTSPTYRSGCLPFDMYCKSIFYALIQSSSDQASLFLHLCRMSSESIATMTLRCYLTNPTNQHVSGNKQELWRHSLRNEPTWTSMHAGSKDICNDVLAFEPRERISLVASSLWRNAREMIKITSWSKQRAVFATKKAHQFLLEPNQWQEIMRWFRTSERLD